MRYLFIFVIIGAWLTLISCQDETSTPITNFIPDDTSNGGGGGNSPWILNGPVVYQNGVLIAADPSDSGAIEIASATTREAKSFSGSQLVTYTWRQNITGSGIYQFSAGSDTSRLQDLPITELSANEMRAQMSFYLGFDEPLRSRFTFVLPPQSSVRISDYNAAGD
ncbi:MAG: hypothetical protein V2A61_06965 [Calditrichota bacterium]